MAKASFILLWEDRRMGITENISSTSTSLKSLTQVSHPFGNGRHRASWGCGALFFELREIG